MNFRLKKNEKNKLDKNGKNETILQYIYANRTIYKYVPNFYEKV